MRNKQAILPRNYSEQRVKKSFSKVAWFYYLWSRLTESKAARKAFELARMQDGETILEVAVGTGVMFEEIVKGNPNGRNEGVDISASMLSKAEKRLAGYPRTSYQLHEGTAYQLPFAAETFDLIINSYMLDLLPEEDFITVLREFHRVLKPSARVVITAFAFGAKWYNRIWYLAAKHFPTLLTECRPIYLSGYLAKAGFKDIRVERVSQNTFPSKVVKARKGEI